MATATRLLSYEEWLALPENDEGREECVNGVIEKMSAAKWEHALIVESLADLLHSTYQKWMSPVFHSLIEMNYEFCVRVLETTDFGILRSQKRCVLIASKVGLPYTPGILPTLSLVDDG